VEASTGAALVSGVFRKTTAIVTSALILFFTVITLILWIANPVMDCGCFGEAIHLTHGQTLLKNLVLVALALIAFIPFQNFGVPRKGSTPSSPWPSCRSYSPCATTPVICR
jgi:hypothetical protein